MIPAHGHLAWFGDTKCLPVVAWDDDGHALVSDGKGALVRASSFSDFDRVEGTSGVEEHAIPGGGWFAEYRIPGQIRRKAPVVAWQINELGFGVPLVAGRTAVLRPGESCEVLRVWHPDESS